METEVCFYEKLVPELKHFEASESPLLLPLLRGDYCTEGKEILLLGQLSPGNFESPRFDLDEGEVTSFISIQCAAKS